jgi:hypothetical protein
MSDPDQSEKAVVGIRILGRRSLFKDWRVPESDNDLLFSLDGDDTWNEVVHDTSGTPTTHNASVREVALGKVSVVHDNSIWKEHAHTGVTPATIGFPISVRRAP